MQLENIENLDLHIPPGRWGVAVSGGADSIALLRLLLDQQPPASSEQNFHVLHLDHETRAGQSAADASFVAEICQRWGVPCVIAQRSEIESAADGPNAAGSPPANRSARFRAARLTFFRRESARLNLNGIVLAHHADDWAETVLHRLLRSSPHQPSPSGLIGLRRESRIGGLRLIRPLLAIPSQSLRDFLTARSIEWREDASNQSPDYLRNRLRKILQPLPALSQALRGLAAACDDLHQWAEQTAPTLEDSFPAAHLADLPSILGEYSARRWLQSRGCPPSALNLSVLHRLQKMAQDSASSPRQTFPARILIHRRKGIIAAVNGADIKGSP